jgi:hypothetical protein
MVTQPELEAVRLLILQKARRELKKIRRSGRMTRKQVVRVIELLAELLDERRLYRTDK